MSWDTISRKKIDWDIVPFAGKITEEQIQDRKKAIRGINNAWWLTHRLLVQGTCSLWDRIQRPQDLGMVDIVTFGSICYT